MPSADRCNRRPGQGLDARRVKAALELHAEDLFHAAFGKPSNPRGSEWRARERDSISMKMRGKKRGCWFDHAADAGGDLLDLVAATCCGLTSAKSDFPKVLEEAARMTGHLAAESGPWRGFSKSTPQEQPADDGGGDDDEGNAWAAVLVMALIDRIRPVAGTPAAAYLRRRGITDLPETGMGWLPPVPDVPVRESRRAALLVWGLNGSLWPMGGQRVLLTPKGFPARNVKDNARKPSFGTTRGAPARFAARTGTGDGPLVVAEGPESALSVRQATGHEAWAVFGVSNFKSAPLPKGRTVILAPDRDARNSKAARAFRRAAFVQRSRGIDFLIAEAPEPEGSKKDLNDTLKRAGDDAVRAAIEAARPVTDDDMEDPDA